MEIYTQYRVRCRERKSRDSDIKQIELFEIHDSEIPTDEGMLNYAQEVLGDPMIYIDNATRNIPFICVEVIAETRDHNGDLVSEEIIRDIVVGAEHVEHNETDITALRWVEREREIFNYKT